MDVSKYDFESDGVWVEIEVDSERELEHFRFKVQPLQESAITAEVTNPNAVTSMFIKSVIAWDLTIGETPIPCDEENKKKYLSRFATYAVRTLNGEAPKNQMNIAGAVTTFAQNPDSFLKN